MLRPHMLGKVQARRFSAAISGKLESLASSLPHKDAISYKTTAETGITKWTFSDVNRYANAFGAGLAESSFSAGDALAAWLPPNSQELLVAQFAADKNGLVLVEVDPALTDGDALRKILNDSSAKGLLFDPTLAGGGAQEVVGAAMPELVPGLTGYDNQFGAVFRSRAVSSMKLVMHTGLDTLPGVQCLKYMMVYDPAPTAYPPTAGGAKSAPLSVAYSANGTAAGPVASSEAALGQPSWANVNAILSKNFVAIE